MRDPERIKSILNRLQAVWEKYPDFRLGQLILNVLQDPLLYYIEDDKLIEAIEEHYTEWTC